MGDEMLSVRDISAGYGRQRVLHDVSLEVDAGQFVGLIGPNGCGKTTLLRAVSSVLPLMSGQVRVAGQDLRGIPRRRLARLMGCLPQNLALDLPFTVREVALMGRWPHRSRLGWETRADRRAASDAMSLADVSHLADRPITEISGGERQRVFIAMCLAQRPRLLLLDEPTSHLDIAHQLSVLDLIASLNRRTGMTVLAVFHDLNLASEYCDRLFLLVGGRVRAQGPPQAVLTAETIGLAYQAQVRVQSNPVSFRPHIVVAAGMNRVASAPAGPGDVVQPPQQGGRTC